MGRPFKKIPTLKARYAVVLDWAHLAIIGSNCSINTKLTIITLHRYIRVCFQSTFTSFLFVITPCPSFFNWKAFPLSTKFLIKSPDYTMKSVPTFFFTGSRHHLKEECVHLNYVVHLCTTRNPSLDFRRINSTQACSKGF